MSPEHEFEPTVGHPDAVGTLEALLLLHRDMKKGRLFIHIGDLLSERLAGFIEGYRACLREHELPDEGYARFCEWLWSTRREEPIEKATERHLSMAGGEHERAIRTYLDWVHEFSTSPRSKLALPSDATPAQPPEPEKGLPAARDTLSYLMCIRESLLRGRLHEHLGNTNAERFNTFIDGYNACADDNRLKNELYASFGTWLRDVKRELPEEGWPAKYLRDCNGDHQQAILRYLDFVAEFAAPHKG